MNSLYRIDLGVQLNQASFNAIRTRIRSLEDDPIKIKLDGSLVSAEVNKIRQELNNLGGKGGLKFDTSALEASLDRVAADIREIRTSFGTLDSKSGMGNLLTSINKISAALDNVSNQFVELNTQMSALSKKDFSFNFNLKTGNSNPVQAMTDYGQTARRETIPALQEQVDYLQNLLGGTEKANIAMQRYLVNIRKGFAGVSEMNRLRAEMSGVGLDGARISKSDQMGAYETHIGYLKKIASLNNISLDGFNAKFAKAAADMVDDTVKIQSGVKETEEQLQRLKGIFSSGIDAEKLSAQLDSIVADLNEIKVAIQGLSQNATLEGLTQSFNNLSASLEKLVGNATQAQNVLNNGLNASASSAGTQKAIQEQEQLAQTTTQTANAVSQSGQKVQQAFNQMSSAGQLDPLQLQDDITEADMFAAALSRLKNIQSNIGRIEVGKINTSKSVQELKILETQLESLSAEYNETVARINGMGGVSATQLQSFQNQITTTKLKIEQLKASITSDIKGNFGNYENQLLSLEGRIGKLATKTPELQVALDGVKQALAALKSADGTENLVTKNQQYLSILKQVTTEVTKLEIAERNANNSTALQQQKQVLALKMQSWLRENSAAVKQFGGEIQRLQVQLQNCGNMSGVRQIGRDFQSVTLKAKEAGVAALSFSDRLKKQFASYSAYFSAASVFMYSIQALRSMFEQVKAVDSAMTELKKVTDETAASYNKFLSNAATKAKEIGTTIDGLVSSTADFARLGYGFEDAQGLAEVANIYAVVGDEIEGVEGATESLISTMAAFKSEMNGMDNTEFAMSIIDKFNEIGKLIA